MKMIGIKLADGSFYPIMEEGKPCRKNLGLTTVKDNQTRVLVDLYRSKTGTMEDAEYVDSLQIDNLVEHPNGEANISLNIALDENNKLSADMNDPETGGTSNANITLVSRTVEERLEPTNYELVMDSVEDEVSENAVETEENSEIDDSFDIPVEENIDDISEEEITEESKMEEPINEETEPKKEKNNTGAMVAGGIVAGGGLLAAAALLNKKNKEKEEAELQEKAANDEVVQEDVEDTDDSVEAFEEDSSSDKTVEGSIEEMESNASSDEMFENSLSDMDFADESIDETTDFSENETADFSIPDDTLGDKEDSSFDLDDNSENTESAESDDILADLPDFEETEVESEPALESDASAFGIADFADDTAIDDSVEETEQLQDSATEDFDKTIVDDFSVEEPLVNDNVFEDEAFENADTVSDSDTEEFSLPDDLDSQETVASEELTSEELSSDEIENQNDDNFDLDLPDFPEIDNESTENLDDISSDDNFFDTISDSEDENMNNNLVNDNTPSNGINFAGLYDQETVEGDSSLQEDEVQKKTKAPVIICIICAIICIIATLLILFVVPSKYNLLTSRNTKNTEEVQIVEEVKEEVPPVEEIQPVEEIVPEAKEDEVVVVTEPEQVIPEPPVEPEVKPQNITYKIKWGDTLWDIADTYYKNPWRYRKIARFNNIKNPDYIISGTTIEIPVE